MYKCIVPFNGYLPIVYPYDSSGCLPIPWCRHGAGARATEPQGAAAIAGHRAGHRSIRQAGRLGFPGGKRVGVLPSKMSKIKGLTIQNEGFYHPKWTVLPEFSVFRCLS